MVIASVRVVTRRGAWMRGAAVVGVCLVGLAIVSGSATAAGEPDLSTVTLDLDDLPDGFRLVPEDQLEEVGGSAKQVGTALERSLEAASLQQYLVYASADSDELVELVLVGPLIAPERLGMLHELSDASALAEDLAPSFILHVDQSEPRLLDTTGIGEASMGFAIDSRLTSDSVVVTNILGVSWTEASTQFVLSIRGDYLAVMVHQYVGGDHARADFLGAARHVDTHLAAALGLAAPGVFRPGGTFSPEVANNIPTAGDVSTEPSVVFANLLLAAGAVIALSIAMRMLNTTLVAHEDALERLMRPARAVGRWWASADDALVRRSGSRAGFLRVAGVLLFYGILFSFLEDGWRPWTVSGLFVLVVMTIAFGVVGTTDDLVELRSAHRWGMPASLVVKPALLLFAVGSVALTKIAGLVPGLMIGTPEAFSLEDEVDDRNELRLARVGLGTTAAVALGAWLIATPLDALLDGSTGAVQSAVAAIVSLLVLVFAVAVENLFANLLAFPGSEGATLRRHHRAVWWASMVAVTALFFHTLINPRGDLAESLESTNVQVVIGTVAAFVIFTIGVRMWFGSFDRRRRRMVSTPLPPPTTPMVVGPPVVAAPLAVAHPAPSPIEPSAPPPAIPAPTPTQPGATRPVVWIAIGTIASVLLVGLGAFGAHMWNRADRHDTTVAPSIAHTTLPATSTEAPTTAASDTTTGTAGTSVVDDTSAVVADLIVPRFPQAVAFDGTHLWVTIFGSTVGPSMADEIDPTTGVSITTLPDFSAGVAFDGVNLWFAGSGHADTVSVVDPATGNITAVIPVAPAPYGFAFDGTSVWVSHPGSDLVSKIDPAAGIVVATVAVGIPGDMVFDGTSLWVLDIRSHLVSRIDPVTTTIIATVQIPTDVSGLAFDGSYLWVGNSMSMTVTKIDPATGTIVGTVPVGDGSHDLLFDGTYLWVTNALSDTVSKIDPSTDTVLATLDVGNQPWSMAFDGIYLWIVNLDSGTLSKILP